MASGIWAILKAGGAYVPLDPAYPADRLAFLIEDSVAPVILAEPHLVARLPAELAARVVVLGEQLTGNDCGPPLVDVRPDHPAYVIYTSGSTGVPQGVVVPHRGVVNHAEAAARLMDLTPADRVLQSASISFDIAIEEMFPAWITGAAVVVRGDDADLDPAPSPPWWPASRSRCSTCRPPTGTPGPGGCGWVDRAPRVAPGRDRRRRAGLAGEPWPPGGPCRGRIGSAGSTPTGRPRPR